MRSEAKILLQDRDTEVLFDFGMSLGLKKKFYLPPFLSPRNEKSLLELGILPQPQGVYRFDEKELPLTPSFCCMLI